MRYYYSPPRQTTIEKLSHLNCIGLKKSIQKKLYKSVVVFFIKLMKFIVAFSSKYPLPLCDIIIPLLVKEQLKNHPISIALA